MTFDLFDWLGLFQVDIDHVDIHQMVCLRVAYFFSYGKLLN